MASSRKDILKNYECEGQITIFEWLKEKDKICDFSGHSCNKTELWKIAHTFDDITCPETCCRSCKVLCCGARCNGSEEPTRIYEIDIRGLLDDGYCPKCGYAFKDWLGEVDCDCPECKAKIDWSRWHILNDISSN